MTQNGDNVELDRIVWCDADLSDDGLYRYRLTRRWGGQNDPCICWIMLNPSTADAVVDDPTIRRCISFSEAWGFGSLIVVNLFALRSTDPKALLMADVDPIGPENDHAIRLAAVEANCVMAAWGTKGAYLHRNAAVIRLVTDDCMEKMHALTITKDGHPKHPLYVKGGTSPVLYRAGLTAASGRRPE
jgi:hypothetical protein